MDASGHLERMIGNCPALAVCREDIEGVFEALCASYDAGGKLLVCGNGGSAADAEHIAGELMKGFLLRRPLPADERAALTALGPEGVAMAEKLQRALPCLSLNGHPSVQSAFANDVDPAMVYAQQVWGYGRPGDVLLCISTSGGAVNAYHAAVAARGRGVIAVALTGEGGGRLAAFCDYAIRVPAKETYRVQEYHLPVYHTLCAMLEAHYFAE